MPNRIAPQLVRPTPTPPAGDCWVHEIKHDGHRVVAYLERGRVRLKTRAGNDATARFAPITDLLAKLPVRSAVLDGRDRGAGCARRHQPRSARPGAPRSRRAAALAELLKKVPDRILYSDDLAGDGAALFAKIGELGGSPAKPGD